MPPPEVCDAWRLCQNRSKTRGQLIGGDPGVGDLQTRLARRVGLDGGIAVRRGELQQAGEGGARQPGLCSSGGASAIS
jgi:hypothetical protein